MDREDPIAQFFPDADSVDLYDVLSVKSEATFEEIKKAYRRLALTYHPDKHATATDAAKADASLKFQQIGFAYAVLGDEKRRQRYDRTGKTDEGFELSPGEDGWETYFEELFDRVTKDKLDDMKKEYQGSAEELEDIKKAYLESGGSIAEIMNHIPHSTYDDEVRFIVAISDLIQKGDLPHTPTWDASIKDEKAKLVRKKQSEKEAQEAETLAKELGIWDEFYGSGKPSSKKGKGKGKGKGRDQDEEADADGDGEDYSVLQAIMLKRKKDMDGFFDSLAAKYGESEPSSKSGKKGKKRGKATEEQDGVEESPKKKLRNHAPPEIDDEEFERLQQKLFGNKAKSSGDDDAPAKPKKGRPVKGRKAK
ncbi:DnaJ subfamily C member 9 [Grifola frondosa]|uniref:DnaJ subfamily C member 9 n=1 Tax=Grifola frondosa TaxID=5627 RepID=A0A1C7MF07_GRIFR|nr:DnaJ subfamily C member 9 [Grifola frondosa]